MAPDAGGVTIRISLNLTFHKLCAIMTPIDVNSAIKQSATVSISLACLAFVFWQSVQCIEKYIENPQGTKLSLQRTSKLHQFPAITICRKSDKNHLKRCGLRYDKLSHSTTGKLVFPTFIFLKF